MDDFDKGRRGESANVGNQDEYNRGRNFQRGLDSMAAPPPANGPVITGENPVLQAIVTLPFLAVGALLYPVAAVVTGITALIGVRLMPLVGSGSSWTEYLAFIPALLVFWLSMRWEQRAAARYAGYRLARHAVRVGVFAAGGALLAGYAWRRGSAGSGGIFTLPHVAGAIAGAALGHLLLAKGERWREFWYSSLQRFRMRSV